MGDLIKKYGPIFNIKIGSFDTVVLADYDLIKKGFNHPDLTFRPSMLLFEIVAQGGHGKKQVFGAK